ncbi:MAG: hypothetical protein J6M55_03135 [Paludibacteraceae bacterium]|nr:hypothetical protein [Paludibacteraceae bacterium]
MKKMYKQPETEALSVEMTTTLCSSQTVTIKNDTANGAALAPGRNPNNIIETY